MAVTTAIKSGPCLCGESATCPRISPLNLGTSYFKDKVIIIRVTSEYYNGYTSKYQLYFNLLSKNIVAI